MRILIKSLHICVCVCKFYISSKHFEENSNLTYLKQLVSFTTSPKHLKENHWKAFPLHIMIPNKHDPVNVLLLSTVQKPN